ncbi:MAG: DoxX family protein [Flavobacteriales bacterium]|nr:DoxX family protein [Flavobacteriales bacterium]
MKQSFWFSWLRLALVLAVLTFPLQLYFTDFFKSVLNAFSPLRRIIIDVFGFPWEADISLVDSYEMLLHLTLILVLALPISRILLRFDLNKVRSTCNAILRIWLSFVLIKYGAPKLFNQQFYLPEPNTAYTPLGLLDKDILFWSTMGTSWFYSFATGLLEVIAGVGLWFKKTKPFALFLALFISGQILVINISFEITVKILSSLMLLVSLVLSFPYLQMINRALNHRNVDPAKMPLKEDFRFPLRRHMKFAVVVLILLESFYPFVSVASYNDDSYPRPLLHGAFEIDSLEGNWCELTGLNRLERIHFHRHGYLIFQNQKDRFRDYKFSNGVRNGRLVINLEDVFPNLYYDFDQKLNTITISNGSLFLRANRMDYWDLPALKDGNGHIKPKLVDQGVETKSENEIVGSWSVVGVPWEWESMDFLQLKKLGHDREVTGVWFHLRDSKNIEIVSSTGCNYGMTARTGKWSLSTSQESDDYLNIFFNENNQYNYRIISQENSFLLLERL